MSASPVPALAAADLTARVRTPWVGVVVVGGLVGVGIAALVAAGEAGAAQADRFRADSAAVLLIAGLVLAVGTGCSAVNRDARQGWLGLLAGSGASRPDLALGRVASRLALVLGAVALWGVAMQVGSLLIGRGLDGPLGVHTLTMAENLAVVLLAAAAVSTVFGPVVSAVLALTLQVAAQSFTNLKAAADLNLVGSIADPLVNASYRVLPHTVLSPMIVDLQTRDLATLAAPQFRINQALVVVPASGVGTVLWTLGWCALLAWLTVVGTRRRTL